MRVHKIHNIVIFYSIHCYIYIAYIHHTRLARRRSVGVHCSKGLREAIVQYSQDSSTVFVMQIRSFNTYNMIYANDMHCRQISAHSTCLFRKSINFTPIYCRLQLWEQTKTRFVCLFCFLYILFFMQQMIYFNKI